jgi:NTP-dependent ternary system trypsin peptidase co-occuring protein
MDQTEVVQIRWPNGQLILAQAHVSPSETGVRDVSLREELSLSGVSTSAREIASTVLDVVTNSFEKSNRTTWVSSSGLSLAVKSGRLTGLLVEGSSETTLKITLQWQNNRGAKRTVSE